MEEDKITPELFNDINIIALLTQKRKLEAAFVYNSSENVNKYIDLDNNKRAEIIKFIKSTNEYNEICTGSDLYFIKKSAKLEKISTDSWFIYLHLSAAMVSININYLFLPNEHISEAVDILSPNVQYFQYLFLVLPNFGESAKMDFLEGVIKCIKTSYIDFRLKTIDNEYDKLLFGFKGSNDFKEVLQDCKDKIIEKAREVIKNDIDTFLTTIGLTAEEKLFLELKEKE